MVAPAPSMWAAHEACPTPPHPTPSRAADRVRSGQARAAGRPPSRPPPRPRPPYLLPAAAAGQRDGACRGGRERCGEARQLDAAVGRKRQLQHTCRRERTGVGTGAGAGAGHALGVRVSGGSGLSARAGGCCVVEEVAALHCIAQTRQQQQQAQGRRGAGEPCLTQGPWGPAQHGGRCARSHAPHPEGLVLALHALT